MRSHPYGAFTVLEQHLGNITGKSIGPRIHVRTSTAKVHDALPGANPDTAVSISENAERRLPAVGCRQRDRFVGPSHEPPQATRRRNKESPCAIGCNRLKG